MDSSIPMNWKTELLNSFSDDVLFDSKVDSLKDLLLGYGEDKSEAEALGCLRSLQELLEDDSEVTLQIIDRTNMLLCHPCLSCCLISKDCFEASKNILLEFSAKSEPKEVFAGDVSLSYSAWTEYSALAVTDGVSVMLEDATANEISTLLSMITEILPVSVQRIQRKKERFISISLELVCKMLQRLKSKVVFSTEGFMEISPSALLRFGYQMMNSDESFADTVVRLAYTILVLDCYLYLTIQIRCVMEIPVADLAEEIDAYLYQNPMINSCKSNSVSAEDLSLICARKWIAATDSDEVEEELMDLIFRSLALIQWGSLYYDVLPKFAPVDLTKLVKKLCPDRVEDSPYFLAAMELLDSEKPRWQSGVKEITFSLLTLMQRSPVEAVKSQAPLTIQVLLRQCNEGERWSLLGDLVAFEDPDIAALMVQNLKSFVVNAFDKSESESVFHSKKVTKVIRNLLTIEYDSEVVSTKSDLLCAILNLSLFLVTRSSCSTTGRSEIGIIDDEFLAELRTNLEKMKTAIESALAGDQQDMHVLRLQLNIDHLSDRAGFKDRVP